MLSIVCYLLFIIHTGNCLDFLVGEGKPSHPGAVFVTFNSLAILQPCFSLSFSLKLLFL